MGAGVGTASALVDLLKMGKAEGVETNGLIAMLIQGERPLQISILLESSGGRATVYLTGVELSGAKIAGPVLQFLLKEFFIPLFPNAKIGEPFELREDLERIEIRPDGVRVVMKRGYDTTSGRG